MRTSATAVCIIAVCCLAGRSLAVTVKPPLPNSSGTAAADGALLLDGVSLNGLAPQDPVLDPLGSFSGVWSGLGPSSNTTGATATPNATLGNSTESTPFAGMGLSSLNDIVNMISGGGAPAGETTTTGAPTYPMFPQGGAGSGPSILDSLLGDLGVTSTAPSDLVRYPPGGLSPSSPSPSTPSPNALADLVNSFGPGKPPPASQPGQQHMLQQMMVLLMMMREGALEL